MTPALPVSVIVVSRDRPEALRLCLIGVTQLDYPSFEIVVVADQAGADVVAELGLQDHVRLVPFDKANISAARNAGLAAAAGQVVAFIDDDAVPEPSWLIALIAPFADRSVAAAGGYVRGRNGISFQWKGRAILADGRSIPLDLDPEKTTLLTGHPGRGIKTEGTNMAFRREVLAAIGGFDPAFRFYHDEADLNLRLAEREAVTAIVPLAEVHHGYAASDRRRTDRVPLTLFDVGASTSALLRKHGVAEPDLAKVALVKDRRQALVEMMVAGLIEPGEVARLMKSLHAGFTEGDRQALHDLRPIPAATALYLPFKRHPSGDTVVLKGSIWRRKKLRAEAAEIVAKGGRATVLSYSRTAVFHSVRFRFPGYWDHRGGLYGRLDRDEPVFRITTMTRRFSSEIKRIRQKRRLLP